MYIIDTLELSFTQREEPKLKSISNINNGFSRVNLSDREEIDNTCARISPVLDGFVVMFKS